MEVPGPYYDGAKDVIVSLVYEGKHIQAKVVKINRPKTNRRLSLIHISEPTRPY